MKGSWMQVGEPGHWLLLAVLYLVYLGLRTLWYAIKKKVESIIS